ncbi:MULTISPECIES: branched-chain amino acid ABC transporter permease [Anaerolinea]|uniref:Branched-chain amino acid ABC transporter permease protein n=1 Tax=Anaerolinea thermophila (strain DSM 14523 / JCM 11388 / NBRC 100420 / UNI-1) TaxID=926569 RepID=E8N4F9_ANATU|nr:MULTISPECIES: branched-chain amino acid ABC transporter permease [Anaerolinea]BAJ63323.1 branched-chain amino acid ABC transporter permease protein [Anaerolinea thermophila UNI-1]
MNRSEPMSKTPSLFESLVQQRTLGYLLLGLILLVAIWRLGNALLENPSLFLQQVTNGLQIGFVYALIALGYTMVYGIVRLINFAHGDVFMVGAFTSFYAISRMQLHLWPRVLFPNLNPFLGDAIGTVTVVLLSMVVCALLAVTIERVAYKPLRNAPRISALITAIGVSFFLEYFGALNFVYTANYITYRRPFDVVTWVIGNQGVQVLQRGQEVPPGAIIFSNISFIIIIVSIILLVLLQYFVKNTRTGKAMRATAYDRQTARLMGVDVDATISTTFAIGAALAGAAGVLYAIAYPQVVFWMGIIPGLKAFVAAVLGGIGSIPGAVVGALILGQAETLSAAYISTPMRDAIAFSILIIVLLVRPTGIFGEAQREKA